MVGNVTIQCIKYTITERDATYPRLSMYVVGATLGWVRRKRLVVHDAPDGCLKQCQDKAHLPFQDP